MKFYVLTKILLLCLLAPAMILSQTLDDNLLYAIQARMNESAVGSWEIGTRAETLLELSFPSMSVFSSSYLTKNPPTPEQLTPIISIAQTAVSTMTTEQFMVDGSAGDPVSIGVAVLLANYTGAPGYDWAGAAAKQLDALLNHTPRSDDGALSHRTEYVQLWNDFIYMVPPFLAYYGVLTSNTSLITKSYNQIRLYRSHFYDSGPSLWRHVTMATAAANSPVTGATNFANPVGFDDTGHWSTGNGWAAAGMLRVLATILNGPPSFLSQFTEEVADLKAWIQEIHVGMTDALPASGIFPNYAIATDATAGFPDASSTAFFASTVYRAITLYDPQNYATILAAAEHARTTLYGNYGADHFDAGGWLFPVCDPNMYAVAGGQSSEGQAFVLQLDNNWKAWKVMESQTKTAMQTTTANPTQVTFRPASGARRVAEWMGGSLLPLLGGVVLALAA